MSCGATLLRRGVPIACERWHREDEIPTHSAEGHYWGGEGITIWEQCPATATYCGEELRCDVDLRDGKTRCGDFHCGTTLATESSRSLGEQGRAP